MKRLPNGNRTRLALWEIRDLKRRKRRAAKAARASRKRNR